MNRNQKERLSLTVNERVRAMRASLSQAMANAQQRLPDGDIRMKDGYSGLRYLSCVLYNSRDLEYVTYVPNEELFMLLVDGIEGAALYRIGKRKKPWPGM